MIYLVFFICISIMLLLYMRFEAGFLKIERVWFTKSTKCLKIIHLSDIHINRLKVPISKVKAAIMAENPDMVILTGDYIEKARHKTVFLNFLKEVIGEHKTYICLGNHDYEAYEENEEGLGQYIREIEQHGAIILNNNAVYFEKNSKKYNIIGIDDIRSNRHNVSKALKACKHQACTNIAFTHNPDVAIEIPKGRIDYLLCGHFHGGQIWMPFNLEFLAMREDKLSKMGIKRGMHKFNGIMLYINRGLGNVCLPMRFLSRPELAILYIP